jgi:HlyD family secretion protein
MSIRESFRLSNGVLAGFVVVPLGIMGLLSVIVLWPALKDPESGFYSSAFGYPALRRIAGKPIQVETETVTEKKLSSGLAAPGESVPLQEVDVRSQVAGAIEEVYVREGQVVHLGQPLLQLEKAPFEDRVNTARNNLAVAQKNLQTVQSSIPPKLLNLRANVRIAQERLYATKSRLKVIDNLADQQLNTNLRSAEATVKTSEEKLKQAQFLYHEGAFTKFQVYDLQDIYATRKRDLLLAQQGLIDNKNLHFADLDYYITRRNDLITAQQTLTVTQASLDQELQAARLDIKNSKIALHEALRDLKRTVVYARTDGLVSKVNIHRGDIIAEVTNSITLMTLAKNIVFQVYIDQARLNAIKVGDQATVRLVAYPGRTFEGEVIQLNPTVSHAANAAPIEVGTDRQYTYSAWIAVDDLQMPPGLQGYVQFDQVKTALVIPESSVTHLSAGEGMVMVNEAGKAVVKKVKLGRIFDNQREVLGGLKLGAEVVISPRALNPGDRLDSKSTKVAKQDG